MTLRPLQRAALVAVGTGSALAGLTGVLAPAVAEAPARSSEPAVHGPWAPEGSFIGPSLLRGDNGNSMLHRRDAAEPLARKFK